MVTLAIRDFVFAVDVNWHWLIQCSSTPDRMYKLHILGFRTKDGILNDMIQKAILLLFLHELVS
jgi:hypothetical protein